MLFKNYNQIVSNGQTPQLQKKRRDILDILTAALESVDPYNAIKRIFQDGQIVFKAETLDISNFENVYVVSFGKASVGMAQAVCDFIPITKGVVVTNDPFPKLTSDKIEVVIGGHPIPSNESITGAKKIVEIIKHCNENDLLLVLISGGGSALLCKPRVSLRDLRALTKLLLQSGADINDINTVRKHLSYVKGGQLVKLAKCRVVSLIISDIVNDPIEFIASGTTSPDSTTFSDAKKVLEKYSLWKRAPPEVRNVIEKGIEGNISETPKKDDPIFNHVHNFIVANNETVCSAAAEKAKNLGYVTQVLTTTLT
ncbi:MAG: glycerate kinase type-2 family protein, partial [Petrotogales bacterium]